MTKKSVAGTNFFSIHSKSPANGGALKKMMSFHYFKVKYVAMTFPSGHSTRRHQMRQKTFLSI
jgi:hypothetical protein